MVTATLRMPGALAEAPKTVVPRRRHWFSRFMDAVIESRMRRAEQEIRLYRHLMPDEFERVAEGLTSRNEDQLPFIR